MACVRCDTLRGPSPAPTAGHHRWAPLGTAGQHHARKGRVSGVLEPSRAFGDWDLRGGGQRLAVSAAPHVATATVGPFARPFALARGRGGGGGGVGVGDDDDDDDDDENGSGNSDDDDADAEDFAHCPFLVLGTDGLFDFVSHGQVRQRTLKKSE